MNENIKLQQHAKWLGYLGVIPFMSVGLLTTDINIPDQQILFAIQAYAAIILTFVGAVHWGRALESNNSGLLLYSVLPSLFAWLSLLIPAFYGLPLLVTCFLIVTIFDFQQYKKQVWFQLLRINLSFIVCSLLLISWLFTK